MKLLLSVFIIVSFYSTSLLAMDLREVTPLMAGSVKYDRYGIKINADDIVNDPSKDVSSFSKSTAETRIISNDKESKVQVSLVKFDEFKVAESIYENKKNIGEPSQYSKLVVTKEDGVLFFYHCEVSNKAGTIGDKDCIIAPRHYCDYLKSKNLKSSKDFAKLITKSKECRKNYQSLRSLMSGFSSSPEYRESVKRNDDYNRKFSSFTKKITSNTDAALNVAGVASQIFKSKRKPTEVQFLPANYQLHGSKIISGLASEEADQFLDKTIQLIELCKKVNTINETIEPSTASSTTPLKPNGSN